MSQVVLDVPDELYELLRKIAEASGLSVKDLLLGSLDTLLNPIALEQDIEESLRALQTYTDAGLLAVFYRQTPDRERYSQLIEQGRVQELDAMEEAELQNWIEQSDKQTLLKAEALVLLQKRGYDIDRLRKLNV